VDVPSTPTFSSGMVQRQTSCLGGVPLRKQIGFRLYVGSKARLPTQNGLPEPEKLAF
jgi:hypothetical protein